MTRGFGFFLIGCGIVAVLGAVALSLVPALRSGEGPQLVTAMLYVIGGFVPLFIGFVVLQLDRETQAEQAPSIPVGGGEWTVRLLEVGPNKVDVIEVVRVATELTHGDARDLVESAPCDVARKLDLDSREVLAKRLTDVGARVDLLREAPPAD